MAKEHDSQFVIVHWLTVLFLQVDFSLRTTCFLCIFCWFPFLATRDRKSSIMPASLSFTSILFLASIEMVCFSGISLSTKLLLPERNRHSRFKIGVSRSRSHHPKIYPFTRFPQPPKRELNKWAPFLESTYGKVTLIFILPTASITNAVTYI